MAIDEAIAVSVRSGESPPTLRLYGWDSTALSLGRFQKISSINDRLCNARGIFIVRRPTGGRAILHGDGLTYSISARTGGPDFTGGLLDSYAAISSVFCRAFESLGMRVDRKMQRERGKTLIRSPLCFQSSSYGEILFDSRKIMGSAQKRWREGFLQQGEVPYATDRSLIPPLFGVESASLSLNSMTGLKEIMPGLEEKAVRESIIRSFEHVFRVELRPARLSRRESDLADTLAAEKYSRDEWTRER